LQILYTYGTVVNVTADDDIFQVSCLTITDIKFMWLA